MAADTKNIFLSVIIPSFNEEARIGKTLRSIDAYLRGKPYTSEVIVVDDGSEDATADVVKGHAGTIANLTYMRLVENQGKGWAVRSGMLAACGRFRLFMDADGSTDVRHWDSMLEAFDRGADIVVGSRHAEGAVIEKSQAWHRETLGSLFRKIVQFLFGLPIIDTQNGFKAFRADAAEKIFKYQRVKGWAFDVETLLLARKLVYVMEEMPVVWVDDERSRMTYDAMPKMLLDLLRIRFADFTPVYTLTPLELPRWEIVSLRETRTA